jgi:hypothetical protein
MPQIGQPLHSGPNRPIELGPASLANYRLKHDPDKPRVFIKLKAPSAYRVPAVRASQNRAIPDCAILAFVGRKDRRTRKLIMPADIGDRFVRNTSPVVEPGPRPDAIPETREVDTRFPFMPALASAEGLDKQLCNAHSGCLHAARVIREAADKAWQTDVAIPGINLTATQRHAAKKARVAETVALEVAKATQRLRPIVERNKADLLKRREALVEKGQPKPDDIGARRAMMIGESLARLTPEMRALRISEAIQQPNDKEARELLSAVAWLPGTLDLTSPETRQLISSTLIATSNELEYASLTATDRAIQATSESLDTLETWAASLPEEY